MLSFPYVAAFSPATQPFATFFRMFNEMQGFSVSDSKSVASLSPHFDVEGTDENYILKFRIPGTSQHTIAIDFSDDKNLTIRGHTEYCLQEGQRPSGANRSDSNVDVEPDGSRYVARMGPSHTRWTSDRRVEEFARSFSFPTGIDQTHVSTAISDGVLIVVLPKLS